MCLLHYSSLERPNKNFSKRKKNKPYTHSRQVGKAKKRINSNNKKKINIRNKNNKCNAFSIQDTDWLSDLVLQMLRYRFKYTRSHTHTHRYYTYHRYSHYEHEKNLNIFFCVFVFEILFFWNIRLIDQSKQQKQKQLFVGLSLPSTVQLVGLIDRPTKVRTEPQLVTLFCHNDKLSFKSNVNVNVPNHPYTRKQQKSPTHTFRWFKRRKTSNENKRRREWEGFTLFSAKGPGCCCEKNIY